MHVVRQDTDTDSAGVAHLGADSVEDPPEASRAPEASTSASITISLMNPVTELSDSKAIDESAKGKNTGIVVSEGDAVAPNDCSFKTPAKRWASLGSESSVAKRVDRDVNFTDSKNDLSDSSSVFMACPNWSYEVEDIKSFLKVTKNQKGVHVEEYFPDLKQFMAKVKCFMGEGLFENPETYRKKIVVPMR